MLEDRRGPHDIQVRVLLARERGRQRVFGRRAGSDRVGGSVAEPCNHVRDGRGHVVGDDDSFEGLSDIGAEHADRLAVVGREPRQSIEMFVNRGLRQDPLEGVRRHTEPRRHTDAFDPRELS